MRASKVPVGVSRAVRNAPHPGSSEDTCALAWLDCPSLILAGTPEMSAGGEVQFCECGVPRAKCRRTFASDPCRREVLRGSQSPRAQKSGRVGSVRTSSGFVGRGGASGWNPQERRERAARSRPGSGVAAAGRSPASTLRTGWARLCEVGKVLRPGL